MADREIDFDLEYFQRSITQKAEKRAVRDRGREFGSDDEVGDSQIDAFYEARKEHHYKQLMKQASDEANQNIPLHVETAKTADAKAVRYKLKDDVDLAGIDFGFDVAIDKFFDTKEITIAESKQLESQGYFRAPYEAIAFAKGSQSKSGGAITSSELVEKMNAKSISVSDIAEAIGNKPETVLNWTEKGVPQRMTKQVTDILG